MSELKPAPLSTPEISSYTQTRPAEIQQHSVVEARRRQIVYELNLVSFRQHLNGFQFNDRRFIHENVRYECANQFAP